VDEVELRRLLGLPIGNSGAAKVSGFFGSTLMFTAS
jgi:hypothetical protein